MTLFSKLPSLASKAPLNLTGLIATLKPTKRTAPHAADLPADVPAPIKAKPKTPDLDKCLVIPVSEEPHEEQLRSYYFSQGQFLARQERWDDLTALVKKEDKARNTTPAGLPVAELLCQGARADVVSAAEHVLMDGTPEDAQTLCNAISALEHILGENPGNFVIATTVALAHLDIAWAWRGTQRRADVPVVNLEAFDLHSARAISIMSGYCGIELNSALVTSARCLLLVGQADAAHRAADDYEDLIDLAPESQRYMRALGHHMLPQWFGSYQQLELEARRTASRTQDIWGAGAYTWVYFDALLVDPACAATLDIPFFLEGLTDILERSEDQHTANLLAAFTAVAIPRAAKNNTLDLAASAAMEQIQSAAHWIFSDHLHELHPLVWGHAAEGFDNQAQIASIDALFKQGRDRAHQVMQRLFGDQIARGNSLIFTPQGLYIQQP